MTVDYWYFGVRQELFMQLEIGCKIFVQIFCLLSRKLHQMQVSGWKQLREGGI